jgi:hypothetical protein
MYVVSNVLQSNFYKTTFLQYYHEGYDAFTKNNKELTVKVADNGDYLF